MASKEKTTAQVNHPELEVYLGNLSSARQSKKSCEIQEKENKGAIEEIYSDLPQVDVILTPNFKLSITATVRNGTINRTKLLELGVKPEIIDQATGEETIFNTIRAERLEGE